MNKYISFFIVFVFMFTFSACSGGISREEAKADIEGFWAAVQAENYDDAAQYLHPEHLGNAFELKCFIRELEKREDILFSSMVIEGYTGFQASLYNSSVAGSEYCLTMRVSVSGKQGEITTALARNDSGYGIHQVEIEIGSQHLYF